MFAQAGWREGVFMNIRTAMMTLMLGALIVGKSSGSAVCAQALKSSQQPVMSGGGNSRTRASQPLALAQAVARMRARSIVYEPHMLEAARRYGVDPRVLWTIAYLETRFQPNQVSPKGARGMMQFMPETAATYGLVDSFNPIASIDAAARYVRYLAARFDHRIDLILAGYNSGEGTVEAYLRGVTIRQANGKVINPRGRRTGGVPPYEETRNYVARGLSVAQQIGITGIFSEAGLIAHRVPLPSRNGMSAGVRRNERPSLAAPDSGLAQASEITVEEVSYPSSVYAVRVSTGATQSDASITISSSASALPSAPPASSAVPAQPQSTYVSARVGKR